MSRGGPVHAGIIPGTPAQQAGEMQYFITQLGNGELGVTVTMVKELAAGRFALMSPVGKPGPEMPISRNVSEVMASWRAAPRPPAYLPAADWSVS